MVHTLVHKISDGPRRAYPAGTTSTIKGLCSVTMSVTMLIQNYLLLKHFEKGLDLGLKITLVHLNNWKTHASTKSGIVQNGSGTWL